MDSPPPAKSDGRKEPRSRLIPIVVTLLVFVIAGSSYFLRAKLSAAAYRPVSSAIGGNIGSPDPVSVKEVNQFRKKVARRLQLSLFQSSGSTVLDGNWIYMNQELTGANAKPSVLEKIVPVVSEFSEDLKGMGVDLIFCPIPPKWAVYPGPLIAQKPGTVEFKTRLDHSQHELLERLRENEVTCIDLLPEFLDAKSKGGPLLFPPDDTHISPTGAKVIAETVAKFLKAKGVQPTSTQPPISLSSETRTVQRVGDLRKLLLQKGHGKLDEVPFPFDLQPILGNWEGSPEHASSICLIGDSNLDPSLRYQSDGTDHAVGIGPGLAFRRDEPVSLFWQGGDGATVPRRKFLNHYQSNTAFRESCRVVVWIVTARILHQPERFAPTPIPPRSDSKSPIPTESDWLTFSVEIESLSDTPGDLRSLAYANGLQTASAFRVDPETNLKGPKVVLYRDFMKARKKIAPEWKIGERIEVSVRPWEPLSNKPAVSRLMIFDTLPFGVEPRYYAVTGERSTAFLAAPDAAEENPKPTSKAP